jgi:hypothetical protein
MLRTTRSTIREQLAQHLFTIIAGECRVFLVQLFAEQCSDTRHIDYDRMGADVDDLIRAIKLVRDPRFKFDDKHFDERNRSNLSITRRPRLQIQSSAGGLFDLPLIMAVSTTSSSQLLAPAVINGATSVAVTGFGALIGMNPLATTLASTFLPMVPEILDAVHKYMDPADMASSRLYTAGAAMQLGHDAWYTGVTDVMMKYYRKAFYLPDPVDIKERRIPEETLIRQLLDANVPDWARFNDEVGGGLPGSEVSLSDITGWFSDYIRTDLRWLTGPPKSDLPVGPTLAIAAPPRMLALPAPPPSTLASVLGYVHKSTKKTRQLLSSSIESLSEFIQRDATRPFDQTDVQFFPEKQPDEIARDAEMAKIAREERDRKQRNRGIFERLNPAGLSPATVYVQTHDRLIEATLLDITFNAWALELLMLLVLWINSMQTNVVRVSTEPLRQNSRAKAKGALQLIGAGVIKWVRGALLADAWRTASASFALTYGAVALVSFAQQGIRRPDGLVTRDYAEIGWAVQMAWRCLLSLAVRKSSAQTLDSSASNMAFATAVLNTALPNTVTMIEDARGVISRVEFIIQPESETDAPVTVSQGVSLAARLLVALRPKWGLTGTVKRLKRLYTTANNKSKSLAPLPPPALPLLLFYTANNKSQSLAPLPPPALPLLLLLLSASTYSTS